MKKFLSMIGLLLMIGMIVGCSDSSDKNDKNSDVSLADIYEDIRDKVKEDMDGDLGGFMEVDLTKEETDDPAAEIYMENMDLKSDHIENGMILGSLMNVNSNEIILIEATDEEHVDSIKESLEKQLENEYRTWEQYLPDQFEKVKNNIIKTNGKFLLYVTYDDEKAIEDIFDSHFE